MNKSIPTHCALTTEKSGKLYVSLSRAKAILTLIQNDGENADSDGFISSKDVIMTALGVVDECLETAQACSEVDFYFTQGGEDVSN